MRKNAKILKGLGFSGGSWKEGGRGLMKGAKSRHLGKLSEVAEFQVVVAARVFKSGGSLVLLCSL